MTNPAVKSTSPSVAPEPVAIVSVDPGNNLATATTRFAGLIQIDTRYHVGAVHVTPAVGDQWMVRRFGTNWILVSQLPANTSALLAVADNPIPGLTQIGSTNPNGQGPLHLNGTIVTVNAPLGVQAVSTANRPSATTMGPGTHIFDLTLGKPIWSDGTNWVDSTGATV